MEKVFLGGSGGIGGKITTVQPQSPAVMIWNGSLPNTTCWLRAHSLRCSGDKKKGYVILVFFKIWTKVAVLTHD